MSHRAVVVLLTAAVLAAGCSATLTRRELVVHFSTASTPAQHEAAQQACVGAAPHTSPEPIPTLSPGAAGGSSDVRFRIDHANDHDIARLEGCLARQPGVVGFEDTAP